MKKIRITALLLIVFLILTACSSDSASQSENENRESPVNSAGEIVESVASYFDTLGERDFEGATFTILDANDHPSFFVNFAEEVTGEPVNDALYERDRFISEKYGVDMNYIQLIGGNNGCSTLERAVIAGDNTYDLIVSQAQGNALDMLFTRNVLYNLIDAPYLSLQSPWWSKLLYENLQFNNKLFYTGGDIFLPAFSQAPAAIYYNQKLLRDYGIEDNLYNLVFEGKWTLDALNNIIKDRDVDLNQDGRMHADDDFFGMINTNNAVTSNIFATAAGIRFSAVTGDNITVDLASLDYINKIDKLASIVQKINFRDQNDIIATFKDSRAMFLVQCLIVAQMDLRDMEDDFGILPMPKWDGQQESYRSYVNAWASGFVAVPSNADIEKSAFLMEAMGYAAYERLRPVIYDITLKTKVSRDDESARIIDLILETCYLDLNSQYNFGGSIEALRNAIIEDRPFVSEYERITDRIQADIDRFIEAMSADK